MKNPFPERLGKSKEEGVNVVYVPPGSVDMTEWFPKSYGGDAVFFEIEGRPWILPYLVNEKQMSGFWGNLKDTIERAGKNVWGFVGNHKWIVLPVAAGGVVYATSEEARKHPGWVLGPMGTYFLGYALQKWGRNVNGIVKKGVDDAKKSGTQTQGKGKPQVKSPTIDIMKELSSNVIASYIYSRMQQKALERGETPEQISDQTWAYTAKYGPEFASMGLTPEEAYTATLLATEGAPPNPDVSPKDLLNAVPSGLFPFSVKGESAGALDVLKKYWPFLLGLSILLLKESKGGKVGYEAKPKKEKKEEGV